MMNSMKDLNIDQRQVSIQFERQDKLYHSGEQIRGSVVLELEKPMEITGVEVKLYGGTSVRWTDNRDPIPDDKVNIEYNVEEIYFKKVLVLWGRGRVHHPRNHDDKEVDKLSAGKHVFPFRYNLPTDIPCSFEGIYGSVRYYAKASVLSELYSQNLESTVFITVLQDLNLSLQSLSGVRKSQEISIHSCFRAGSLTCTLSLPSCGFVPGQIIRADISVKNKSTRKVQGATLSLKQIVRYGSDDSNKSRKVMWEIQHLNIGSINAESEQKFVENILHVPSLPPSRLDCCQFIDIKYDMVVSALCKSHPLLLSLPIIIGTLPHGQCASNWEYKEQFPYPGTKWRSIEVDGTRLEDDEHGFIPAYKYYHSAASCKYQILDNSPSSKRKHLHLNNEHCSDIESETTV
ncbi:arrestin domain-containing protein 3-like [Tubulanus polymorphus]|uniref:arrestin domain-containing protein 3-like n=1 Tax=Tubulanus polymorphus TaxID=672921 RepID=UPI003DA4CA0E